MRSAGRKRCEAWSLLQTASRSGSSASSVRNGFALPGSVGPRWRGNIRSHHGDFYEFLGSSRGEGSDKAETDGGGCCCTAMGNAEFIQEIGDVTLDCPRSYEELIGDLHVGVVLAQQP